MTTIYNEKLLDLQKNARFQRALENPDRSAEARNRLCGDDIKLYVQFDDLGAQPPPSRIALVCYEASGCAVMKASAALLAEALQGVTTDEADLLAMKVKNFIEGDDLALPNDSPFRFLEGVRSFPARKRCALLPFEALTEALQLYSSDSAL